jgi:hypothetical protein
MVSFGCDLTEQYLNKVYEDLSKEHLRLMTDMKNGGSGESELKDKETDLVKQITLINTLMLNCMKLRNLKKKLQMKLNSS